MPSHITHEEPKPRTRAPVDLSTADPLTAITERDAARILGIAPITLTQKRLSAKAPPHFKVGRSIRYVLRDVLAWRDARTVGKRP